MKIHLRHMLALAFTVIAVIPVLFLGAWVERTAMEKEIAAVSEKHLLLANNITAALDRYTIDVSATFDHIIDMSDENTPSKSVIELARKIGLHSFYIIDNDGRVTFTLIDNAETPVQFTEDVLARLRPQFSDAPPVFSDVMADSNGRATIFITRSISSERIAIGILDLAYVRMIQKSISFGRKGYSAIVDKSGTVIAHPRPEWQVEMKNLAKVNPVARMMAGESGVTSFFSPAANKDMITGYTTVPNTGWGVMVPQPLEELEEHVGQVKLAALSLIIIGLIIAAIISWWISGLLTRPVEAVIHAAREIVKGNLDSRVPPQAVGSPVEFRELGSVFNSMADDIAALLTDRKQAVESLRKARDELEMRVTERTSELSTVNSQLLEEITERERIEEALRKSGERYREIFDESPVGILVSDWSDLKRLLDELEAGGITDIRDHFIANTDKLKAAFDLTKVVDISRATINLFGARDRQELIDATRASNKTDEELIKFLNCVLEFWQGRTACTYETESQRLDGGTCVTLSQIVIPPQHYHDWSRVIFAIQDITEHKLLEEQLLRTQRMEAVGQLTGSLAHDFNNLLATMLGNVELLKDAVGNNAAVDEYVDAIKTAVGRGASLTSRLLAFSRKSMLSPVVADVTDLINSLEDMLRHTLGETINLKINHTPMLWSASIDLHQFESALVNLALNARDAMLNGGILLIETANASLDKAYTAQYDEVTSGDYVLVSVSDTGIGMSDEVQEKAFEPFFTTKDVGKGSGLGLSMVFSFAKQSKGHVSIYRAPRIMP